MMNFLTAEIMNLKLLISTVLNSMSKLKKVLSKIYLSHPESSAETWLR